MRRGLVEQIHGPKLRRLVARLTCKYSATLLSKCGQPHAVLQQMLIKIDKYELNSVCVSFLA